MRLILCFLICIAAPVYAQGFAGLGTTADGFAVPERGTAFRFPADHAAHPEFRIEWWYLTATLQDEAGTKYGLQWTLFRSALAPRNDDGWDSGQLWMGHAAVTTPGAHFVAERRARGGIGQAGVEASDSFTAWIDEWRFAGSPDLRNMTLKAGDALFGYDMSLTAQGPLVFHGDEGYSVKSAAGQASYYYSQPFYEIQGTLRLPDGEVAVSGHAWLDREWSSQPLASDQRGWDWFSLAFDDGARLMGFALHGAETVYTSATWIDAEGRATAYPDGAFQATPLAQRQVAGRAVPTTWRVQLAKRDLDVTVRALNPESWMDTSVPYWEGPIDIEGSHTGRGYLEMTGY